MNVPTTVNLLNSFESPKEIAEFLINQNVQGRTASEAHCVISKWITKETGYDVFTDNSYVTCDDDSYEISDPVADFIEQFDSGVYPELVEVEYG